MYVQILYQLILHETGRFQRFQLCRYLYFYRRSSPNFDRFTLSLFLAWGSTAPQTDSLTANYRYNIDVPLIGIQLNMQVFSTSSLKLPKAFSTIVFFSKLVFNLSFSVKISILFILKYFCFQQYVYFLVVLKMSLPQRFSGQRNNLLGKCQQMFFSSYIKNSNTINKSN